MPVMNGIQATLLLRRHGISIPIVAVTGNALAEDVNAFMLAGANSVLTKVSNSSYSSSSTLHSHACLCALLYFSRVVACSYSCVFVISSL